MTLRSILVKSLDCFFLLRIPLLAPVWTILLLGWITGNPAAHPGGILYQRHLCAGQEKLWLALVGFSLIVAAIYVVNQIADIESDRINRKLFLLPCGIIKERTAWILAALCAGSGLIVGMFFDLAMMLLFIASLVLGALYDLPPACLKNHPWGGTAACFIGHGMLAYLVGWYAAQFDGIPRLSWPPLMFVNGTLLLNGALSSLSAGFANAAVFVATTIPDAPGDRAIGKRTFCVAYGEKKTAAASLVFCIGALLACGWLQHHALVMIIPTILSVPVFALLSFSASRSMAFTAFKWPVFALTTGVAIYIPFYAVLIAVTFFGSKMYYRRRFGIEYPTFKAQ